jgi:hypothetical protein
LQEILESKSNNTTMETAQLDPQAQALLEQMNLQTLQRHDAWFLPNGRSAGLKEGGHLKNSRCFKRGDRQVTH